MDEATKQKSLTTKEQDGLIEPLRAEIEQGFAKLQIFRSEFLMRNSVLAMNATLDGKYWQGMLERNVHFWELLRLKYDYEEKICNIDIEAAKLAKKKDDIAKTADPLDRAILEAEARKQEVLIKKDNTFLINMKKEAEQRIREITTWSKIINELKPQLKYSQDDPEEHQAEEWAQIYAKRIEILQKTGSTDMDGTINTLLVGNKIFQDEGVLKLIEQEQRQLLRDK